MDFFQAASPDAGTSPARAAEAAAGNAIVETTAASTTDFPAESAEATLGEADIQGPPGEEASWVVVENEEAATAAGPAEPQVTPKTAPRQRPEKPPPPVNPAALRKAVHLILPLLVDRDPGAKDCLKDNRAAFRPAFSVEAYEEFENSVKRADFEVALEQLKRAAKRHGITV